MVQGVDVMENGWVGSATAAWVLGLSLLLTGAAVVLVLLEQRRETGAHDAHAHADGTVHEHFRGSRPHAHPTLLERYDALLDRSAGSPAGGTSPDRRPQDP